MKSITAPSDVRIDKWLWAVRICKTRLIATDLCKRQRVSIDGQEVKPSRVVLAGQVVLVRREGFTWQYRVLQCIDKRVGAKAVKESCEDITPQDEKDRFALVKSAWVPRRAQGEGRPTKKDRRAVDRLMELVD
jgi:ribosome-associated heat shock protein Hsp15